MSSRRSTRSMLFDSHRTAAVGARKKSAAEDNPALQAIWDAVCAIPRGRISTYGAVARAAGFPGRARQAGHALKVSPKAMKLPWHRVVGAGGRIVFAPTSAHFREQSRRLRAEGLTVSNGRIARFATIRLEEI